MIAAIIYAIVTGVLVILSRQVNGRLSLSTSPMTSSFYNHLVGFAVMSAVLLALGGLWPSSLADIPPYAWLGGPLGVIFVAAGSWVIPKIGAVNTAVLIIGGQMIAGAAMDMAEGVTASPVLRFSGLALILVGILLAQARPRA
ncbi:DMT family transporter [Martelella mediterranea]|uniref:DMT family transporter n=1 Tax=Martelella mediterranea TaxID=293089 RepID=UPI001E59BED8|nr:DMT family transporter [Martelella mediterranea]MCD1636093.1 DMT family transporter [Martelella mediterranea]